MNHRKQSQQRRRRLYGLEYHGVAGSSEDCQHAIMRLLQYGTPIIRARVLSSDNTHCLFLIDPIGDYIAVKSGFTSGYLGEGSRCFSVTLELLYSHGTEIEEIIVERPLIERLDLSALTIADVESIVNAHPVRPSRWPEYILDEHEQQGRNGTLWRNFPPTIPFSIIDPHIMDLAREFWNDPDGNLLLGYRRLEDLVRKRTGLVENSAKLFARAFAVKDAKLTWNIKDEAEKNGRANLFTNTYMAYRNPRAHRENPKAEMLTEFLLLNHLYRLEREAVNAKPRPALF